MAELTINIPEALDAARSDATADRMNWSHDIVFDPYAMTVTHREFYGTGTYEDVEENRVILLTSFPDGIADTTALVDALQRLTPELRELADLHEPFRDGWRYTNHERAEALLGIISDRIGAATETLPLYYDAEDVLGNEEVTFPADFRGADDDFDDMAVMIIENMRDEGAVLRKGPVLAYLRSLWAEDEAA